MKYFNNCWVNCHGICLRRPRSPWLPAVLCCLPSPGYLSNTTTWSNASYGQWNMSTTVWWIGSKFGTDIHGSQTLYPTDPDGFLTFAVRTTVKVEACGYWVKCLLSGLKKTKMLNMQNIIPAKHLDLNNVTVRVLMRRWAFSSECSVVECYVLNSFLLNTETL